jgi:O-antigen ligase
MKFFRRLIPFAFFMLVAFAPSLTRYIWRMGDMAGHPVEPGTLSLFGMQLVAAAYVALVFATRKRNEWKRLSESPEAVAALSLAAAAVVASAVSDAPLEALVASVSVVLAVLVFCAIVLDRPDPHETVALFFGAAVFQAGFGIFQFFAQEVHASKWLGTASQVAADLGSFVVETESGRWLRAYGLLPHPNVYGTLVALGVLAAVGLAGHRLVTSAERYRRALAATPAPIGQLARFRIWARYSPLRFYAPMPFLAAGLLFSFSRTAFVAVMAGFAWLVVGSFSGTAPAVRRVIVPSAVIILTTLVFMGGAYSELLRVRTVAEGRLEQVSVTSRITQANDALNLLFRHPFVGVGMNRMPYRVRYEVDSARSWWLYDYVHDVPLLIAVETGLAGLLAWLAFVGLSLRGAFRRLSHRGPTLTGTTAFAAMFIALLVAGLFDHFLWSSWFGQLIFWIVAGMLQVAVRKAAAK